MNLITFKSVSSYRIRSPHFPLAAVHQKGKEQARGGPLVFEVGYHPHKKIHVIRVVFQDQAMYTRTSFRGAKTCKIRKKGVLLVILANFGKGMTDKSGKMHAKTRI